HYGTVSVPLAWNTITQPHLIERLETLLQHSGLDPSRLPLEITESFTMNSTEEALAALHGLKRLCVQLAIADFGTGYS
ncbi:EAL domain-containing protein, partial [Pseudomonas aeruginosa]